MNQKPLPELTLEELKTREKKLKTATAILAGAVIVMILAGGFLTFKQGFTVFTVLPAVFLPMWLNNRNTLKKIKEEITSRTT